MVTIKQNLANKSNYGSKRASNIQWIVIHMTANDGDHDESNGNYFHNNTNLGASAHYFVDSDSITQSVPDDYVAYSVGKDYRSQGGGKYYGICANSNSISIELCDDVKNGLVYPSAATIKNALDLANMLMKKYSVSQNHVIRHWDVNGKKCPSYWIDDSKWKKEFWNKLSGVEQVIEEPTEPKPIKPKPIKEERYTREQFVKDVQTIIGAKVDGIPGAETLSKTITISNKKNNKHPLVKCLQKRLNTIGFDCGDADGIAGTKFDSATKQFQKSRNCVQDGEFTAKGKSWSEIFNVFDTYVADNKTYAVVQTSGSNLTIRDQRANAIGTIPNETKIVVEKKCACGMKIGSKTYTMALVTYGKVTGYVAQNYLRF